MIYKSLSSSIFISFILSFFYGQIASAQICKYTEYHSLAGLAKKSYSEKKYEEAKRYFQLAFSKTEFSFGEDLHLALFTANKLKDDSWAIAIAEDLAKGGIPMRYFVRFKKEKWFSDFQSEFTTYSKYYFRNFNKEFREKFTLLLEKDAEFIENYHKWRTREIEISLNDLIDKASDIVLDFEQMIEKFGFPYERLIGYNYVYRKSVVEPFGVFVLLVHTYQHGVSILKDDLSQIVCEGGLALDRADTLRKIDISENNVGVEQNMTARYLKYRGTE